jgi:hypothetical protein
VKSITYPKTFKAVIDILVSSLQAKKICDQACGLVAKYTVPTPASPFSSSDYESDIEASTASSPEESDDQDADQTEEQTLVQLPDDIFVTSQPYHASSSQAYVHAPASYSSAAPGSSFIAAPCSQVHNLLSQPGSRFYGMDSVRSSHSHWDMGVAGDLWSSHCLMSF